MKKLLTLLFISLGLVWGYFWYVRSENLLDRRAVGSRLPAYAVGIREPAKDTAGALTRWRIAAPMPTPRMAAGAAALDGKIYVVGGVDAFARTIATVEAFDIAKNEWSTVAPLPTAVQHAAVASDGARLFVFGGFEGLALAPVDRTYVFNPKTGKWAKGADLPKAIGAAAVAILPDGVHLIGGLGVGRSVQDHYVYQPDGDRWRTADPITSGRDHLAAATIGDVIYAAGGRAGSLVYNLDELEILRPSGREWEQGAHMPAKRSSVGAAGLGGLLYVFGGEAPSVTYGDVFVYDPQTDHWKVADHMPTPRHSFAHAAADGRIFVIGGGRRSGFSVSDLVEVFTP